jgi:LuxR family maltose regulon positive regulatory protein
MIADKQPQLLATKIVPPASAGGLIDRPRLLSPITQARTKQLTVIKGGPGFGKTALTVAWANRLQKSGSSVAWLALDKDDDEPTRFLFYVCHSLRRACQGVGEAAIGLILEASLVQPHTIVSMLINDLADVDDGVYLFLDDFHGVTNPTIHDAVYFY